MANIFEKGRREMLALGRRISVKCAYGPCNKMISVPVEQRFDKHYCWMGHAKADR